MKMGRAIIKENLKEGQYKVDYRLSDDVLKARLVAIDEALEVNAARSVETQAALDVALLHMRGLTDLLNGVLSSTTLTPAEKEKQSREIVTQQQAHRLVLIGFQTALTFLAAQRLSLQAEYVRVNKIETTIPRTVWSADYSPDLGIAKNEVGTIEVPGEDQEVLLAPAKNLFRAWNPKSDGDMAPVLAQSPMAWLYNTCVVTGWQKYRPTYRFAKVLKILDADHMEVEIIEPLQSTYGNVDISPTLADQTKPLYTTVVCDYLDCNTQAFTAGDEVVVQYVDQNPDKPKVIGFRRNPKPCRQVTFYTPTDALTIGNFAEAQWKPTSQQGQRYGTAYWVGDGGACSWHGWKTRYFPHAEDGDASRSIYTRGQEYVAPGIVLGGCLVGVHLLAVCQRTEADDWYEVLYRTPLADPVPNWEAVGRVQVPTEDYRPWFFSQSGLRGASVQSTTTADDPPLPATRIVSLTYTAAGTVAFATAPPVAWVQETIVEVEVFTLVTTNPQAALDYVGETLVTFATREDYTILPYLEYSDHGSDFQVVRTLTCAAVGVTLTVHRWRSVWSGFFESDGGIRQLVTVTLTTPDAVEHVNVTAGAGRVVSVLRTLTLTSVRDNISFQYSNATVETIDMTQQVRIQVGLAIVRLGQRSESASYSFTTGAELEQTENFADLDAMKAGTVTHLGTTACDRAEHLLTSSAFLNRTQGSPGLPPEVVQARTVAVGLG